MSHPPGSLEQYLIPPDTWDLSVPGEVRIHGIKDEGIYPTGYGRHPKDGWFVLGAGQGPFIIYAEWLQPGVVELTDFGKPTRPPEDLKEPLIQTLDRLRAVLQAKETSS